MADDRKIRHHAFDSREPGDRAAAEAIRERDGPPTFSFMFDTDDPRFLLFRVERVQVQAGPVVVVTPAVVRLTDAGIQGLIEGLTCAREKLLERRAELEAGGK